MNNAEVVFSEKNFSSNRFDKTNPTQNVLPLYFNKTTVKIVLLIGCGYWGRNYARILAEDTSLQKVIVCDQSLDLVGEVIKRYPNLTNGGTDFMQRLEEEKSEGAGEQSKKTKIDACIIATPPVTHAYIVEQCLLRNKHVLVEKPFTTNSSLGQSLVKLAQQRNICIMVGHTFLFNKSVHELKKWICSQEFGELYYFHATRTNLGPVRNDVNVMWDLAAHDISIFLYIMGSTRPIKVAATGHKVLGGNQLHKCDIAFLTLYFPGNKIAHIHVSWCEPSKVRRIVAVGSKSRIEFNDMHKSESLRIYRSSVSVKREKDLDLHTYADQVTITDGDILIPFVKPAEPLKDQVHHFFHSISNGSTPGYPNEHNSCAIPEDISSGAFGNEVVVILEHADRSVEAGGIPVAIEWGETQHGSVNRAAEELSNKVLLKKSEHPSLHNESQAQLGEKGITSFPTVAS